MESLTFVGREQELAFFEEFLQKPGALAILLRGDGGIGKTQLLRNFGEIAAKEGHWVHFLSLQSFRGSTELNYFIAESLSSGKYIIGKEINSWKEVLQSDPKISDLFLPQLEYSIETDIANRLQATLDLITQQIPNNQKLIIIFDEIDAAENLEKSVLLLESLLRAFSSNTKIKLIFSSRPLSILDRLARYHNLSTIDLRGLSIDAINQYISIALPGSTLSKENIDSFTNEFSKLSEGSPLALILMLGNVKRLGFKEALVKFKDALEFLKSRPLEKSIDFSIQAITKDKEDILDLLKALALLGGSATTDLLMELLNKDRHDFVNIANQAYERSFIKFDKKDSVIFVHDLIRDYIIQKYIFPSEFKPTLLDFGSEEAERDHLLEINFIFNNALWP